MLLKNYYFITLAKLSKNLGRGKYYRKKLFSTRRILENNYPLGEPFSFLQVGANDGVSFDSLYSFVTKRKISGIAIEPINNYFLELCKNYSAYPDVLCINKAVHETASSATIYKVNETMIKHYPDWVKGIASFSKEHITKFDFIDPVHIQEEIVEAAHLMNIIENTQLKSFDYFQVDTEGYDLKVINMFDFRNYKPKIIKAEYINLAADEKKAMRKILKKHGYFVFSQGLDIIGIDLNKIKL